MGQMYSKGMNDAWGVLLGLLVIHSWYFIIEVDVITKLLLFLVVFISSVLNQFIHNKSNESLTVAYRTYVIGNVLLCLYSVGLITDLIECLVAM